MRTYARVERNIIREFFTTNEDIKELFHPSMKWIDISEVKRQPLEGWVFQEGSFSPPVAIVIF